MTFPNAKSYPIFVQRLGWIDLPRLRLWARPLRLSGVVRYALGRTGERGDDASAELGRARRSAGSTSVRSSASARIWTRSASGQPRGYGSHFTRDAEYFNWRYLDSPRDYRCFGAYRGGDLVGVAVVGHTFKHGISAGFLADLVAAPEDGTAVRALAARALDEVKGGADAVVVLAPRVTAHRRALARAGFAPSKTVLRFIGKTLHEDAWIDERPEAWHFTLGDFDFF